MSNDYSLYKLLFTLSENGNRMGKQISKDEFMEEYKGSNKESIMEKIFSVFDKGDYTQDGVIDLKKTSGTYEPSSTWQRKMRRSIFQIVMKEGSSVPEGHKLCEDNFIKQFGKEVSVDNFKEALQNMNTIVEKQKMENQTKAFNNFKSKYNQIPDVVLKTLHNHGTHFEIKKINHTNQELYEAKHINKDTKSEDVYMIDKQGSLLSLTSKYFEELPSDEYGEISTNISYAFDENNPIADVLHYTSGLKRTLLKNYSENIEYKKTQFNIDSKGTLDTIVVNKGLPNETEVKAKMIDGELQDIAISTDNSTLKLSDETKKCFTSLHNKGLTIGVDYTLEVKGNEISVEIITPDNMPDNAKNEIDRLGKNYYIKGIDYSVTDLDDGKYAIDYLSNKSRNFESDTKRAVYSADGTVEIIAENKEDKKYNVPADFEKNLCKLGEKEYISDSSYTQQINNDKYQVSIQDNKISVQKNGKEFFIDTQEISDGAKKLISSCNPAALYKIASQGIQLKLEKPETGGDGEYIPDENAIYIDPEPRASSLYAIQRRIAHEVGHTYYTHKNPVNKELEESFKKESELYQAKVDEIKASVPQSKDFLETSIQQAIALEKWDKYAPENSDERYCATNVYEFVAEAYCLYTSGDAKSAFTLVNVYPETFQIFKQMMKNEEPN